jgi:hypothetical protein
MRSRAVPLQIVAVLAIALASTPHVAAGQRAARSSVNANRNTNVNRNANVNRNTNVNQNVNVNRNVNVNVNRDVDINVNHYGPGYGYGCCYHPVATAAAVAAAAVVTAAVVGSMVHTLPPTCTVVAMNGISYQHCGSAWYQPQFSGTSVTYIVVNQPR